MCLALKEMSSANHYSEEQYGGSEIDSNLYDNTFKGRRTNGCTLQTCIKGSLEMNYFIFLMLNGKNSDALQFANIHLLLPFIKQFF